MDKNEIKDSIIMLSQSNWWRLLCDAIDENIKRLDLYINDDSIWCEENDKSIYSWRVLNIKQKKILINFKDMPQKILSSIESQIYDDNWQTIDEIAKETIESLLK